MKDFTTIFNRASANDPLKVFNFAIEIDGFARFGFMECSKLEAQTDVVEYREGADNTTVRKSPGLTKFPDITLKRGQITAEGAANDDILKWYKQVYDVSAKNPTAGSNQFRRTINIVQLAREGIPAVRWEVVEAWPMNFAPFSDLNAKQSEDSIAQLVICHEGWKLVP